MTTVLDPNLAECTTVAVVRDLEQLLQATPAWLEMLEAGTDGQNVLNDPRMIRFVLEGQPELELRIVLVSRNDRLICVAPFYVERGRFSFDFSVWKLFSIGAQVLRVFGESVIMAIDAPQAECVTAVADYLRNECAAIDYLHVFGLNTADAFWRSDAGIGDFEKRTNWQLFAMRRETIHRVCMKTSFNEYLETLSSSTRQNLRRTRRRFFEVAGSRMEPFSCSAEVPRLLELQEGIYRNSWQHKTFGDVDRTGDAKRALVSKAASEGWLRSYVLMRGDAPVAFQHGYHYRDVYYGQESAFDQQYSDSGPGAVLNFCVLEDLHTNRRCEYWDFGFGDLQIKRSFASDEHDATLAYFTGNRRWRLIFLAQQLLNVAYDCVRSVLMRLRIDRSVRKFIKRQK